MMMFLCGLAVGIGLVSAIVMIIFIISSEDK